jgi:uncharacterized protein YuzE
MSKILYLQVLAGVSDIRAMNEQIIIEMTMLGCAVLLNLRIYVYYC